MHPVAGRVKPQGEPAKPVMLSRIVCRYRITVTMGDVVNLGCVTKLDLPPDRILEQAIGQLEGVVVLGYDKDGQEYFASSYADGGDVVWLMERLKKKLLEVSDG